MGWDVDTEDYKASDVASVVDSIVGAPPGAVVLLHDGDGDIPEGSNDRPLTVEAVAAALPIIAAST